MKDFMEASVEIASVEASWKLLPWRSGKISWKRWKLPRKLSRASTKNAKSAGGPFGQEFFFASASVCDSRIWSSRSNIASLERGLRGAAPTPLGLPHPFRTST